MPIRMYLHMSLFALFCSTSMHASLASQSSQTPESLSLSEVLAGYERFTSNLDIMRLDFDRNVYETGGSFKTKTWTWLIAGTAVKYQKMWRYKSRDIGKSLLKGSFVPYDNETEVLLDQENNYYLLEKRYTIDRNLDEQLAAQRMAQAIDKLQITRASAMVATKSENPSFLYGYSRQVLTRLIYGYFPYDNNIYIVDVLKQGECRIRSQPENIKGLMCIVVECDGKMGKHILWLDSKHSYLPRRLKVVKSNDDMLDAEPINTRTKLGSEEAEQRPKSRMLGLSWEADLDLSAEGPHTAIKSIRYKEIRTYANQQQFERIEDINVRACTYNVSPEETGPTLNIPNGTKVAFLNAPGIKGEWADGKVSKVYDREGIKTLDLGDIKPRTEKSANTLYALLINCCLALAIVTALIFLTKGLRRSA